MHLQNPNTFQQIGYFLGNILYSQKQSTVFFKKVLIIKTQAIGDIITLFPTVKALKQDWPDSEIDMLVGEWSSGVLDDFPFINNVITFPDSILSEKKIFKWKDLAKTFRSSNYDTSFIFHPASGIHLFAKWANIPTRIGFDHKGSGFSLTHKVKWNPLEPRYIGEHWADLIRIFKPEITINPPEIIPSQKDLEKAESLFRENGINEKVIIICPGGGRNSVDEVMAKRWPVERFAALIDRIKDKPIIIMGGKTDKDVAEVLIKSSGRKLYDWCGKTSILEMAAVFQKAELVITNDSAPLHIASAVNVPFVGLFGPTDPRILCPPGKNCVIVKSNKDCSPCYTQSRFPGCGNPDCMESITVDQVYDKINCQLKIIF